VDPAAELAAICSGLRRNLSEMARRGSFAAPVGRSDLLPETPPPRASVAVRSPPVAEARLPMVREELGECTRCKLSASRKSIVFGVGNEAAPLMFIGEAPGADEDRTGEPFVGKAGQLLDKMITAMGWSRQCVYIANILKCRPPNNRNPESDEVDACFPFLRKQIAAVAPRLIVTLGKPAAQTLLGSDAPISALRGRFHDYGGIPLMPTFHPAFLLRQPERKRDAWSDLKQVMVELSRLGIPSPHPGKE